MNERMKSKMRLRFLHLRFYGFVTILLLIMKINTCVEAGSCEITTMSDHSETGKCVANMECTRVTEDMTETLQQWPYCGETRKERNCDPRCYWQSVYSHQFDIQLSLKNIDVSVNPFNGVANIKSTITTITITESESIPEEIFNENPTKVEIIHNAITRINLNDFLRISNLNYINAADNSISELQTTLVDAGTARSTTVTDINLSYNLIEVLPNNCFFYFAKLQHLNLSHNSLSNIDMLTFEGISELQTLDFSYNNLLEIGHSFVRFLNLKELYLDNNCLNSLTEPNFKTMIHLQKLNISTNQLRNIEDKSFQSLTNLQELDLSNNQISAIRNPFFINNKNLHWLSISSNNISFIGSGAFVGNNISSFYMDNIKLTGILEKDTIVGIHLTKLDLSVGTIRAIESEAFRESHISCLNMSSNIISRISRSAFHRLESLTELDISNNNLTSIDLDTVDIKNISLFDVHNNAIKKVSTSTFQYLTKLTVLDLSFNAISEVESASFKDLNNLKVLKLNNNNLIDSIESHTFVGLQKLEKIVLDHTRITSIQDKAFSGMVSLIYFNVSHSELSNISYSVFENTGSVEIIDLSHNLLEIFLVNTTNISLLKELYLNNNKLTKLSDEMFLGLMYVQKVELADNNIIEIESKAFLPLTRLNNLDLSSNADLVITADIFDNLTSLSVLLLNDMTLRLSFEHIKNTSIQQIDLSSCNIVNVNTIFIFNVENLTNLDFSKNNITFIDKCSFQNMSSLILLDLSFNSISVIQPGTFLRTNSIRILNLSKNEITHLKFGIFDGLEDLQTLNLSYNAINIFDVNLLHSIPKITTISLDNNLIEDINFDEFSNKSIKKITVGGNLISCHVFTELKRNKKDFVVTSEKFDYHSENVNGVTCRSISKDNKSEDNFTAPIINDNDKNSTYAFIKLANAIEHLQEYVKNFSSKSESNESQTFNKDLIHILQSIEGHVTSNQSQVVMKDNMIKLVEVMNQLATITNDTYSHLVQLDDYIKNQTVIETKLNNASLLLTEHYWQEKIKMLNEEKDRITAELEIRSKEMKNQNLDRNYSEAYKAERNSTDDVKGLLYIIVTCLSVITVVYVCKVMYSVILSGKMFAGSYDFRSSSQPIGNVIEMQ